VEPKPVFISQANYDKRYIPKVLLVWLHLLSQVMKGGIGGKYGLNKTLLVWLHLFQRWKRWNKN